MPGSPYANASGALAAIRFARRAGRAFLGTCGGFQHALIEYAAAIWGVTNPAHAEEDAGAIDPVISPLACALVEQSGDVTLPVTSGPSSSTDIRSSLPRCFSLSARPWPIILIR